ncbi:universal stress protein [uncultured Cellulomonas sp.]|uniref:universal stress protein n=1 Tax=uncultured Cellulomonas sp. TaxID=189682 RepID=UPI00262E4650|nr:universal stress protein [uncultured Cellulomonas sp.]
MNADGAVVIAVDGSAHSARTVDWGLDEAASRGARVLVVQAFQEPFVLAWGWFPGLRDTTRYVGTKRYLADVRSHVRRQRRGVPVDTRVLYGPPAAALSRLSRDAQLLVLGARGRAHPADIGRLVPHLVKHAHCPVAVVGEIAPAAAPVVVGVDGSPASLDAAHAAALEAQRRGVELRVLHPRSAGPVAGARTGTPPGVEGDRAEPTPREVRAVVDALRAQHPDLDVRVQPSDDAADALVRSGRDASVVVVGDRRAGSRASRLTSVSDELLHQAPCPVLVVRHDHEHPVPRHADDDLRDRAPERA